MNTLANPHIAKLRAAPKPRYRRDWPGDAFDRHDESALAARMAKGVRAEGHKARLPVTEAEMEARRQNARGGRKPRGQKAPAAGQTSRAKGEAKRRRLVPKDSGGTRADWRLPRREAVA